MRMNMRAAHAVVVLGILCPALTRANAAPTSQTVATPPRCSAELPTGEPCTNQTVTITFGKNPVTSKCNVLDVQPASVAVCRGYNITWQFVNHCPDKVTAHIGDRKRLFPEGTMADPIITSSSATDLKPIPTPIPIANVNGVFTASVVGPVNKDAECGHYKYDIHYLNDLGKDVTIDPELEVRKGGTRDDPKQEPMRAK